MRKEGKSMDCRNSSESNVFSDISDCSNYSDISDSNDIYYRINISGVLAVVIGMVVAMQQK